MNTVPDPNFQPSQPAIVFPAGNAIPSADDRPLLTAQTHLQPGGLPAPGFNYVPDAHTVNPTYRSPPPPVLNPLPGRTHRKGGR